MTCLEKIAFSYASLIRNTTIWVENIQVSQRKEYIHGVRNKAVPVEQRNHYQKLNSLRFPDLGGTTALENTGQMTQTSSWKWLQGMQDRKDGGNICGTFSVKANELRRKCVLGWFWRTAMSWLPREHSSAAWSVDRRIWEDMDNFKIILHPKKLTHKSPDQYYAVPLTFLSFCKKLPPEQKVGLNFSGTWLSGKERGHKHVKNLDKDIRDCRELLKQELEGNWEGQSISL